MHQQTLTTVLLLSLFVIPGDEEITIADGDMNADGPKRRIEAPLEANLLASKIVIEAPLEAALARLSSHETASGTQGPAAHQDPAPGAVRSEDHDATPVAKFDPPGSRENPAVKPGDVAWHDDLATACAASRDSGKPVLLFQLLGQLDQRFT